MSNKHSKKKRLGDQIYNNTAAEYDSQKYRKNIAENWLSINQKEPPENYTPTVIESERNVPKQNRITSQTKPSKRVPNSPIGDFDLNFDNNDPIEDFFDVENQFEYEENRRLTTTNIKPKSTRKRNHDNEFGNAGHSGEQKKRPHKADYPFEEKSKAKPYQVPIQNDFNLMTSHLATTSRARMAVSYSPIEPFPTDEDDFKPFSTPDRESGSNRQRKNRNYQPSAEFREMGKEGRHGILKYRQNNDKRLSPKTPHPNPFRNMERDFDMPHQSSPLIIASRHQFNLKSPHERKQHRSVKDEIADDFEHSFRQFDERKKQRLVQKTEKQIDSAEKTLIKAERAMNRRFELVNDEFMVISNRYNGHDVVAPPRPILPRPATQPIVYNIKCNNLIIKVDYPPAD